MINNNNCLLNFRRYNSINSLLGFDSILYKSGFNESKNIVNILTINSILVNTDIILGSYVTGSTQPTIYSFFPDVSPGYKIIENLHNLLDQSISADTIHSFTIWLKIGMETSLTYEERICQCDFIWERFKKYLEF